MRLYTPGAWDPGPHGVPPLLTTGLGDPLEIAGRRLDGLRTPVQRHAESDLAEARVALETTRPPQDRAVRAAQKRLWQQKPGAASRCP